MMLYMLLKNLIERGNTDSIREKITLFYNTRQISEEEYNQLNELLI